MAENESSRQAKQVKPHVPLKDFYSVEDVSALLGIGENLVRELAINPDSIMDSTKTCCP
jgi:hypothetical protein